MTVCGFPTSTSPADFTRGRAGGGMVNFLLRLSVWLIREPADIDIREDAVDLRVRLRSKIDALMDCGPETLE